MTVKLLSMAASFREHSLNRKLLTLASTIARNAGARVIELDYAACETPPYREETAEDGLPEGARRFIDALLESDGLILASPEYNWSMPGSLKNLIDWVSVDARKPFADRGALLLCASPSVRGGILGLNQLSLPLSHLGMHVYPQLIAIGNAEAQLGDASAMNEKDLKFLTQSVTDFVHRAKIFLHMR